MGAAVSKDDLMLHILNHLPTTYETTAEICEDDLMKGTLTLEILRERLTTKYRRIKMNDTVKTDSVALYTKQFKGMCKVCGKIGHKGADCFTLEKKKIRKPHT